VVVYLYFFPFFFSLFISLSTIFKYIFNPLIFFPPLSCLQPSHQVIFSQILKWKPINNNQNGTTNKSANLENTIPKSIFKNQFNLKFNNKLSECTPKTNEILNQNTLIIRFSQATTEPSNPPNPVICSQILKPTATPTSS
jgi:hypothetical protein